MTRSAFGLMAVLAMLAVWGPAGPAMAMDCGKARTPVELAICASADLKKADAELSKLYFSTLRTIEGQRHDLLVDSQRLWLRDRERNCAEEAASCVGKSMAERGRQISACFGGKGKEAPDDLSCPYFIHLGCPQLEASGSARLTGYSFLVEKLVAGVKAVEGDFDCEADDPGIDLTRNLEDDSYTIVTERPGLVCIKIRQESDLADAAHPNSSEAMQCYDTASKTLIDVAAVFPGLSAESDALARLRAAADGHLRLGCCEPDDTSEATFEDLNESDPMPTGWGVDDAGNLILAFDQNAFGRLFLATATLPRADFIADVDPAYRAIFVPARK